MKIFSRLLRGDEGHRPPGVCDLLMTSLLLILLTGLLLPSLVIGTRSPKGEVQHCYTRPSRPPKFDNGSTCTWENISSYKEPAYYEKACCYFIFSFGEVPSDWGCGSEDKGTLGLCDHDGHAANDKCVRIKEEDPSMKSVRCVCVEPNCNDPDHWGGNNLFKQWKKHPGNRKDRGAERKTTPASETETSTEDPYGGSGVGQGNLATVAVLLVIAALRLSSPSFFLVTFSATLLLLPSTVSGEEGEDREFQRAKDLTCLSSSNATDDWGDRHCGADTETCCYYHFREIPSWGCSTLGTCEVRRQNTGVGRTVCEEHWDGVDNPVGILCTCATKNCNHEDSWEGDALFREWKKDREAEEETTPDSTTDHPNENNGGTGTKGGWATAGALLKAMFAIIF